MEKDSVWLVSFHEKQQTWEDQRQYLLLDAGFYPGIYRRLVAAGQSVVSLFEGLPGDNADSRAVSPLLIEWQPISSLERYPEWFNNLPDEPLLTHIVSKEVLPELQLRLQQWVRVNADGTMFMLRFADTRRQRDIVEAMTKPQRAAFMGPAVHWSVRNRHLEWIELETPESPAPLDAQPRFDTLQTVAIIRSSEADERLLQIRIYTPDLLVGQSNHLAFEKIEAALKVADAHGVSAEAERQAVAESALKRQDALLPDEIRKLSKPEYATAVALCQALRLT